MCFLPFFAFSKGNEKQNVCFYVNDFTAFELFVIDNVQMLSHGSADLILEACTDFWDGTDIYPLSGSDRCTI